MTGQEKSFERINQKKRTRSELLRSARDLMGGGLQPSVAEVADHAGISKATAYRYFSTSEDLVQEAVLDAIAKAIDLNGLQAPSDDTSPVQRLERLAGQVFDMVVTNEAMFRVFLAGNITSRSGAKRGGRRVGWLSQALAPLRDTVAPKQFDRLVQGLSLALGIETLIVFKDVCDLSDDEAREATLWTVRTLYEGATTVPATNL